MAGPMYRVTLGGRVALAGLTNKGCRDYEADYVR
jgi:hypothetical protein